ncbi:hypothetical protein SDC9_89712 [bioreactor metagenome]|uniref:Uncharacterized protein n=1 Tax=bioreactor metagenome TaxID=1076179 RepID=A0A644ZPY3_9ZZZZ
MLLLVPYDLGERIVPVAVFEGDVLGILLRLGLFDVLEVDILVDVVQRILTG